MINFDFYTIIGWASLFVTFVIYLIYVPSIFQGKTKPHIFSWIIFSLMTGALFWIQYSSGGGAGSWSTAMTAVLCTFITILCFKYGTKDITKSDLISFAFAIFAFIAWIVTTEPFLTLLCTLLVESLGFYPVFRKSYRKPYEEPLSAYYLSSLKMILSLAAMQSYNFYTLAYPVYFSVLYISFCIMVAIRRKQIKHA